MDASLGGTNHHEPPQLEHSVRGTGMNILHDRQVGHFAYCLEVRLTLVHRIK